MKQDKPTCKEVMSHICDNLGEDLNSPKCVAIKHHLDECQCCKTYFNNIESTISFYKNYDTKIPEDAHNKLLDILGLKE